MSRLAEQPRGRVLATAARAFVVAVAVLSACSRAPSAPPSLLLISIDTLRADHLGCYGYARETSPNLDALATRSIRFANVLSTTSWTLPAHATLLTGLYPGEHGAQTDQLALPPSAPTLATVLGARGWETFAATSHVYLGPRFGFARGWSAFDHAAAEEAAHVPVAHKVVDSALRWLDGRAERQRPFFMWLHVFDPHWDYSPPSPFDTLFDPEYTGTQKGDHDSLRPYIRALADGPIPPLARRDLEHLIALYDGEIRFVDHELGRLLGELEARGLLEGTLVAVTSDHGEEFMEHGSIEGHQWTLHDEVVRVPLLLKLPGDTHAGLVVDEPVSLVGVPGTLLDLLGVELGWRSLSGLLPGRPERERPPLLLDLFVHQRSRTVGLQADGLKLLRLPDGREVVYDDPSEFVNVALERPAERARLSRQLDRTLVGLRPLRDAGTPRQPLDEFTREQLRSLGYAP
jgi:arylsulfatase A-like enzyme